jgi:serine/threonine protein kinase
MWSTGAVLYCILSGAPPFSGSESVGEKASKANSKASSRGGSNGSSTAVFCRGRRLFLVLRAVMHSFYFPLSEKKTTRATRACGRKLLVFEAFSY